MTQTQPEEIEHLEALAATYRSRLRVLQRQMAAYGVAVPAHIVLDKQQAEKDLANAQTELRKLRPNAPAERAPYLGLSTFQEHDADLFFGREQLIAELVARAEQTAFLAVLGASGSGKSSMVRAGLIPELKGGALPKSHQWRYATIKPGDRPLDALAVTLAKLQGGALGSALALSRQLAENDRALLLAADMLLDGQEGARLVLVVDQAEELWTLVPADSEKRTAFVEQQQRPFIDLLLTAAAAPTMPVLVVLTMRADFLHRAAEHHALARCIGEHDLIVSPMQPDELRQVIEGPAEMAAGSFEPGLVDELIEQVHGQPGALPMLEYALLELWNKKRPDGTLTWQAYKEIGEVEGALAARADAILAQHYAAPERQDELRRALLRLVQPGEGAADTRRRSPLADLAPADGSIDDVQAMLQPLTDARLLTTGRDPASGADTVEVAHEALIRAWPTLGQWINESRDALRFQIQLEEAVKEWQIGGERREFLWSGVRLAQAEAWVQRTRPPFNMREQRFLEASRAARRHARTIRIVTLGAIGALIVAVLVAIAIGQGQLAQQEANAAATAEAFGREQQRLAQAEAKARADAEVQARRARIGELAAQSEAVGQEFPQRSLLLALEALHSAGAKPDARLPAAEQALRDALARSGGRGLHGHKWAITSAAFSPDGRYILTGSEDGTAQLWDIQAQDPFASPIVLHGHTRDVTSVVFSPDGRYALTGSNDQTARLWDIQAQDPSANPVVLRGHENSVTSVAFSPDSRYALTGSEDRTARLWDTQNPSASPTVLIAQQAVITAASGRTLVAFSPDGRYILTSNDLYNAMVWDTQAEDPSATPIVLGIPVSVENTQDIASAAAFSPNSRYVLTRSIDNTVRLWDIHAQDPSASPIVLHGHEGWVTSVAFNPNGRYALTNSGDDTARLWDTQNPSTSPIILRGHQGWVISVAFSPDGRYALTGSIDNTARLWDTQAQDPSAAPIVLRGHEGWVTSVAFSPDGRYILTGAKDGIARLWNAQAQNPFADSLTLRGHQGAISALAFSSDSRYALTGSTTSIDDDIPTDSNQEPIRLWDTQAQDPSANPIILRGHQGAISAVAFSPDGRYALTGSADGDARLWDTQDPSAGVQIFPGPDLWIGSVALSPDGRYVLTNDDDGIARLWDTQDPSAKPLILDNQHHYNPITHYSMHMIFSPNDRYILIDSDDNIARLWDIQAQDPSASPIVLQETVTSATFSPDGRYALTGSNDNAARLWDTQAQDPSASPIVLRGHQGAISAVAFSPDGRYALTGSSDNTARLWDTQAQDPSASSIVLRGHQGTVYAVVFSPDGRYALTGSEDQTVRLWDTQAQDPSASSIVLRGHEGTVSAVTFSPDGRYALTGSEDRTARLWLVQGADLSDVACGVVGRNLSWEEWQQYFPGQDYRATCPKLPPHPSVIAHGADLAWQGQIEAALAFYKDLQQDFPGYEIDAASLNALCRYGSLWNQAAQVLDACERAVALEPNRGSFRDSRGLARALTGNTAGAIEDFNTFITWAQQNSDAYKIPERKEWIVALEEGRNPFDEAALRGLSSE